MRYQHMIAVFALLSLLAGCLVASGCTYGGYCIGVCTGTGCDAENCACVNNIQMPTSSPYCMNTPSYNTYSNGFCNNIASGGSYYVTSGYFTGSRFYYAPGFHIFGGEYGAITAYYRKKLPVPSPPSCTVPEACRACDSLPPYIMETTAGKRIFYAAPYCECASSGYGVCRTGSPAISYGQRLPDSQGISRCTGTFNGCKWRAYTLNGAYAGYDSNEGYRNCHIYDKYPGMCGTQTSHCFWSPAGGGSCHPQLNEVCTYSSTNQKGNCCINPNPNLFCVLPTSEGSTKCASCIPTGIPGGIGGINPTRCVSSTDCCSSGICNFGTGSTANRCVSCLPLNGRVCTTSNCCAGLVCNATSQTCVVPPPVIPPVPPQPVLSPSPTVIKLNSVTCVSSSCPWGLNYTWLRNGLIISFKINTPDSYNTVNSNIGDSITLISNNGSTSSPQSSPTMVVQGIPTPCLNTPGAVCGEASGICCPNMMCPLGGANLSGFCCVTNGNINCKMGGTLNNSACCSKKCEPTEELNGKCVGCWSMPNKNCSSNIDCCSPGPYPFCAYPGSVPTQKQCLNCIPTASATNCTSSSQCCSDLCNRLPGNENYGKCVSCLPEMHTCSNNSQCCTGNCLFNNSGTGGDNFGIGHCAPLVPPCGQTGALCLYDFDCCQTPSVLFCDKLNPVGIPIDPITGIGTQGDNWGGGIEGGDSIGGGATNYGSCKNCFATNTKCDGIHSCCDRRANCTTLPIDENTTYCLLPAAASPTYLFNSWIVVGDGSFTPNTTSANVHSGSTSAKITGNTDSYIYNSVLQGVLLGSRKYSLEFWAKSESGGDVVNAIYAVFDASNNVYLNSAGAWESAPDDGTPVTISKELTGSYARKVQDFATLGGASIQLRFYPAAGAVYYLDDVSVTEINDFTMSAWVKASGGQANAASLFRQMGQEFGNDQGIDWFLNSDNILTMKFYSTSEGGAISRAPQIDLSDGNWHHVAFSATRTGNYYAYLDGVLKSSGTFGLGRMNSSSPFLIGASDETGSNGFKGQIDEVRFYKRALSSQEVLNHFRGMYQDKCSMDLTVVYNRSTATGSINSAYNAELRLKRQLPDSALSLPFDIKADSDEQGAITDYSRLLQHATKTGAVWTSSGRIGGAYRFNAATDKITVPSSLLSGTGDFTLSAWIQQNSTGGTQRIMGNKLTDDSGGVSLYLSGSSLTITVSGLSISSSISFAAETTWTHIAASRNNGLGKLYINGVEVTNGSLAGSLASTGNFVIGNSPSSSEPFSGTIDEVNVFTRALSDSEIASLYNETVSVSSRPLITSQN